MSYLALARPSLLERIRDMAQGEEEGTSAFQARLDERVTQHHLQNQQAIQGIRANVQELVSEVRKAFRAQRHGDEEILERLDEQYIEINKRLDALENKDLGDKKFFEGATFAAKVGYAVLGAIGAIGAFVAAKVIPLLGGH